MYGEFLKRLWECASGECFNCSQYTPTTNASVCQKELMKQAADAIEELSKPKWIPVTEWLPIGGDDSGAICENVWLLFDDGGVYPGWMNGVTEKAYYINDYDDIIRQAPISCVKMWQPRPEPPKEET